MLRLFSIALTVLLTALSINAQAAPTAQPKEWTFLIYLNGNNNLDSYGAMNLNQIEKIGSTAKINVVVQWASLTNGKTVRMLMQKDNDTSKVTSKVVEDMGQVDMGDYHSITNFVKWAAKEYPAQKYFLDVWDHGSGWHLKPGETMKDISWDDVSGNHITTEQLSIALSDSAKIIGHKIDIYGSDACLMAMMEVANQVNDSVGIFLGSEETEPADGWPYDTFLAAWNKLPNTSTTAEVSRTLTQAYANYYQPKSSDVTLSAFDLNFLAPLNQSIKSFATSFKTLNSAEAKKVNEAAKNSLHFASEDYVDLGDFLDNVKALKIAKLNKAVITNIGTNAKKFIVANNTVGFPKATGAAIWIPTDSNTYSRYADRYSRLRFENETHWSDVAKMISENSK